MFMKNKILALFFLLFAALPAWNQETIINVTFSQPKELKVETGSDLILSPGDSVLIGEQITVSGGTPQYAYLWKEPDGNPQPSEMFWARMTGKYELTVTDARNCTASDAVWILSTSVTPDMAGWYFRIFPNPSQGVFYLQINGAAPDGTVSIFAADGKLIRNLQNIPDERGAISEIDLRDCAPGSYLVRYPAGKHVFVETLLIR